MALGVSAIPKKTRTAARSCRCLTISILSPFLKFSINFETRQEPKSYDRILPPISLSIPDLALLIEVLSRMPRETFGNLMRKLAY
jgi:hypothetical protein